MADNKPHGKNLKHKLDTTALEADTRSVGINVDNDIVDATAAGDTAKETMEGVYGWGLDSSYVWNGGNGKVDDVIFGMFSSGALNAQLVPGGGTVSADNPIYRGDVIVKSYTITVPHDGIVACQATFQGDGVLTRLTSGDY